ncbi:MAG: LytR/AlgR family response regulator transcription factor [Fibrobacterota bacterium]
MKIAILEDEKVSARRLKRMIYAALEHSISECLLYHTFEECRRDLVNRDIDLLLLDLNLDGDDGFEILRQLQKRTFQTIVVSANTDRAIEAFELGVTDFIPKPFDSARLHKALNRFTGRLNRTRAAENLVVKNRGERIFIPVSTITHICGARDYSELHCASKEVYLHGKSLESLTSILPKRFIRIHKSYIVDSREIQKVKVYGGGKYRALLKDGTYLPVSRSRYKQLFS